jgi:hypothetical protein
MAGRGLKYYFNTIISNYKDIKARSLNYVYS